MNEIKMTKKESTQMKINFYSNSNIGNFFFKKKTAHAYFEHRIFLSFLAGKFATFEQMLLTEPINFL